MAWALPRALRRLGAALVHTQYALPSAVRAPAVVTIHDVSFEDRADGRRDRLVFQQVVPRRADRAARVLTVSERTKRDLVDLYGLGRRSRRRDAERRRPGLRAGRRRPRPRRVALRARGRCDPGAEEPAGGARGRAGGRAGARRRRADEGRARRRGAPRRGGARLEGLRGDRAARRALPRRGVPRPAVATRGLRAPVVEAMASGTPVVTVADPALVEVAGDAAVVVPEESLADGIRRALERARPARRSRARAGTVPSAGRRPPGRPSASTARRSAVTAVSAIVVSQARPEPERCCPCSRRRSTSLSSSPTAPGRCRRSCRPGCASSRTPRPLRLAENVNLGTAATTGDVGRLREPGRRPRRRRRRGAPRVRGDTRRLRHRRAADGVAGRHVAADAPRFPTVRGTLVRRTPLRAPRGRRSSGSATTTTSTRTSTSRSRRTGCSALPPHAPRNARRARRLGRGLPPLRRGHRPRATARCARAGSGGTSRRRA